MKNIIVVLFVVLLCPIVGQCQKKTDCCTARIRQKKYKDHLPVFVDSGLFIQDLKTQVDLKSMFDKQKQDSVIYLYVYNFEVDSLGKVRPLNIRKSGPSFENITKFINTTFDNYRWVPGYKRKCKKCVMSFYFELGIHFETDENNISVLITSSEDTLYRVPKILKLTLTYESLKVF